MRVVIAPFNRMSDTTLAGVRAAGHEVLCTGTESLDYADIAAQYPTGWQPDVFLFWSPEYYPIPRGLESAPCLKVAVFGDWNLGGQAVKQAAGMFDLLFADLNGSERLRALGCDAVATAPLWSFDPEVHRFLPDVLRDLDIVLIGNFNHDIQWERARWLGRVARLSSRYRVCLTSGVNGDAYAALLNRAKVVFNRSIRGEVNMRAYEAAACGALLFYERENREIRSLYSDRKECVLYGDDDLESLLDYYLAHEEERQALATGGRLRVCRETPSIHLLGMFETIERELQTSGPRRTAKFRALPEHERELCRARQWLLSSDINSFGSVDGALHRAEKGGADAGTVARLRGYLLAQAGQCLSGVDRTSAWTAALDQWTRSVELNPDYAVGHLNRASILIQMGRPADAEAAARLAHDSLSSPHTRAVRPGELYWPCRFSPFGVEYESIEINHRTGSPQWLSAMTTLLLWHSCEIISGTAYAGARFAEAARFAGLACDLLPRIASTHLQHARALHALGRAADAVTAYREALAINPFLAEARSGLAQLLIDTERPSEAMTLCDEWSDIIAGCPPYHSHTAENEHLRLRARRAYAGQKQESNGLVRVLAFPDWSVQDQWQALVQRFCLQSAPRPMLLMLWADPQSGLDAATLLRQIAAYLSTTLCLKPSCFPNITVIAEPLQASEYWKLFRAADAVLESASVPDEFKDVFAASGLPALSVGDIPCLAA